jgi:hypothetical protein
MIKNLISDLWIQVINNVLINHNNYSSEKTMVFQFAWLLKHSLKEEVPIIDFEKQLFYEFSDGTFLDLYFEYNNQKIGIEFKFPKRSLNGNSNSTQTRIKSINDIKRLSFLVNTNRIDLGVFLMAANEKAYVFQGNKRKSPDFKTYNHIQYNYGCTFPIHLIKSKETVVNPININIDWNGINDTHMTENIAWISPIFIHKTK